MSANDVHVALLRGINVGGKNALPMKELTRLFTAEGCSDVQTYIQTGNVVFRAKPGLARKIASAMAAAIVDRFELKVPVVTRTLEELQKAVKSNPYLRAGKDPAALHLMFLADEPSKARVAALDPKRSPGDEFSVRGRDIYLWLPNGAGRSKLTNAYFDSKLGTVSTGRNWRTVLKLIELGGACGSTKA
jgi:uncharacterized protein (DUF1697 family)